MSPISMNVRINYNDYSDEVFKLCLKFLKEQDLIPKYKKEYFERPNNYNTKNLLNDLRAAIKGSNDYSPFHMYTRGFNRKDSIYGEYFWIEVNAKFIKYLKQHN